MTTPQAPSRIWATSSSPPAIDAPIQQDATFASNPAAIRQYRSYLDSQILGLETHVVQSLVGGVTGTIVPVASSSGPISVGQWVCSTGNGVVPALAAALATAALPLGIALTPGAAGGLVRIAMGGLVPSQVTGLASGSALYGVLNTSTGFTVATAAPSLTDYPVGAIDASGNLSVQIQLPEVVASGGVGVWRTLFDLDFTAQSNQTFATDTTYTIGNLTWTKENSASETVQHAAIVNGTGLVINAENFSGNAYGGGTRTGPLFRIPLTSLFGSTSFDWSTKLRFFVSEGTPTITIGNAGNYNFFGVDSDSTALYTIASRGNKDSAVFCVENYNSATQVLAPFGSSGTFGSGNQTWMAEFSGLALPPWRMFFQGPLSAGAAFPALSTFQSAGFQAPSLNEFPTGKVPANLGLVFGSVAPGGGLTTAQYIFQRLRVDFMQT
jgi:hypothetical protein